MTRTFTDAYIYGWRPGRYDPWRGNASYVLDPGDVDGLDIQERASELKDTASVTVHNPGGKYTNDGPVPLQPRDTVDDDGISEGYSGHYGSGDYGTGLYSPTGGEETPINATVEHGDRIEYYIDTGDGFHRQWTGLVRNYSISADGAGIFGLDFDAEDFAYAIMSTRRVTNAWEDEEIVTGPGSGQGIINTILENECPEIDISELPNLVDRTSISLGDVNVLEAVTELANRADLLLSAEGGTVHLEKPTEIETKFRVTPDDYKLFDFSSNDDQLFNQVRVEGGDAHEVHREQLVQDGWTTVSKSNRHTERLSIRKSEVGRVEIWTDPTISKSGEGITVRLQAGDDTGPIAPGENRSDIARRKLAREFLAEDGFTTFIMPEHDLPDPEPWLIVESEGEIGQDIGIRSNDGALTLRTHYPYPIRVSRNSALSQSQYRLREDTLTDNSASSLDAARDKADAYLNRNANPDMELTFDADSDRMHNLKPGEVVRLNIEAISVSGRFVCVERSVDWTGHTEECEVTVRDVRSL